MKNSLRLLFLVSGAASATLSSAVTIEDVSVTTTTGTYTTPLQPGDTTGEGYFFIPNIDTPQGSGIEFESVDDILYTEGQTSTVQFSYTVVADGGQMIYSTEITPGLFLYDATGDLIINFDGQPSTQLYSDNGLDGGFTAPDYTIDFGSGVSSLTITGQYDLATPFPDSLAYADHLEMTFSEVPPNNSSVPGPYSVLPYGLMGLGALVRRFRR